MTEYRIALRTYEDAGRAAQGAYDGVPLDDIVVRDVTVFRMEDMGDYFWMQCNLAGGDKHIAFNVRRGRKGEPKIVVEAYDLPADVIYEGDEP